jgi:hypothetical protein
LAFADDKFVFHGHPKSVTGIAWNLKVPLGKMSKKMAGDTYGHLFEAGYEFGNHRTLVWRVVAAALAPFLVTSVYLLFTRWHTWHFTMPAADYGGLAFSILVSVNLFHTA